MPPDNYEVPPEVERQLRALSQPDRADDPYLLAPPPGRTGPDPTRIAGQATQVASRAADAGLAALSHFAILFGFLGVGFLLSIGINLAIWLYSRRSSYVAFHARQAGCYQCFVLVFNLGLAALLGVFLAAQIYLHWDWAGTAAWLIILLFIVWFPLSILYGVWAGLRVLLGNNFRYPYFGRRAAS